jgi:N-hydroxyarylamine O-acetyltransferase
MLSVPFENLDIQLGIPIVFSVPSFYEKIVTRRRGGFCYELNGLFAWLLAELGFEVALLSGRVVSSGQLSPEFDHLLLLVEQDGQWIADVGFGDSCLSPLRLDPALGDEQNGSGYSIAHAEGIWTVRRLRGEVWESQYVVSLTSRRLDEFAARNRFQQTSPESHFTRSTICSLATRTGRISLSGRRLIVTAGERRDERELRSSEEYRSILMNEFGIALGEREVARLMSSGPRP